MGVTDIKGLLSASTPTFLFIRQVRMSSVCLQLSICGCTVSLIN